MKAICINADQMGSGLKCTRLTKNKIYEIFDKSDSTYFPVINDLGQKIFYLKERFEFIEEARNKKIDKILE